MNSEIKEIKEYKHKPRSDATLWRYRENGTYYTGSGDPNYKNKYYELNYKNKINCPLCGSLIVKQQISRHRSNKKCSAIQIFLKEQVKAIFCNAESQLEQKQNSL